MMLIIMRVAIVVDHNDYKYNNDSKMMQINKNKFKMRKSFLGFEKWMDTNHHPRRSLLSNSS